MKAATHFTQQRLPGLPTAQEVSFGADRGAVVDTGALVRRAILTLRHCRRRGGSQALHSLAWFLAPGVEANNLSLEEACRLALPTPIDPDALRDRVAVEFGHLLDARRWHLLRSWWGEECRWGWSPALEAAFRRATVGEETK